MSVDPDAPVVDAVAPGRAVIRTLYLRALGACHVMAQVSLWVQSDALFGDQGIAPVRQVVAAMHARSSLAEAPTLLWFWPTPTGLTAVAWLGIAAGLALVAGVPVEGPLLLVAWAAYLSLCTVGDLFLGYQWDALLLEATFAALFVARWRPGPGGVGGADPPAWAWWAQGWLLFRLMFLAGWVKLASGDPTWRDLSALDVHFWTQPLPNPVSRWAHHWPHEVHAAGVVFTFVVELGLPWLMLVGRWPRAIAAAGFTALMGMLALTGNYGFFQPLTVALCIPLLDDGLLPARMRALVARMGPAGRSGGSGRVATPLLAVAVVWAALGAAWIPGYRAVPAPVQQAMALASPFRSVNPYGLFAVMTTDRIEIVFEGSWDRGQTWRELDLRNKPGRLDQVPPQAAPHMPRVPWQLWFAALSTCDRNPWVERLMRRVVDGSPAVLALFDDGTFAGPGHDGPPDRVRALAYRYTFTPPGSEGVWARKLLGRYCAGDVDDR